MQIIEVDLTKIEVQLLARVYGLEGAEQRIEEIEDKYLKDSLLDGYRKLIST